MMVALVFGTVLPAAGHAQTATVSGTLTAVWGDPHPQTGQQPVLHWYVTDELGRMVQVEIASDLLRGAGGFLALDRRQVTTRGVLRPRRALDPTEAPVLVATSLLPAGGINVNRPQLGSKPYAVLLCKFNDVPIEQQPPAFFATLMGSGYPNMQHFYGEISAGKMNFNGTQVYGWFTLPQPRSYYATSGSGDLGRLATDCAAAADPTVDFSGFSGIAFQFNGNFTLDDSSGSAWGGSWSLVLDGNARVWPAVWMPRWAIDYSRYGGYAHELGHSLGLPHSSGPYSSVYDSDWDVMSRAWLKWDTGLSAYVPGHTIAFHKNILGWIPSSRRISVSGQPQTFNIEQSQNQAAGSGPMYATVPIPGTQDFYTIEARRQSGYDEALPGAAVIVHRVPNPQGADCIGNRCARVVDPDDNNDPNDAGAMWQPDETFSDGKGIRMAVNSAVANGWRITVTPGWNLAVAGAGDGTGTVTATSLSCSVANGSVTGTCQAWYYGNGNLTLTATPAANATFAGWSGACSGTGTCTVTVDADRAVTATFTAGATPTCTITATALPSAGGTVSGAGSFACGASRTVVATANPGYTFVSWTEGGTIRSTSPSYTFTLSASRTLVANFATQPAGQLLVVNGSGNGSGTVTSSPAGINCTLVATSRSGSCSATFPSGTNVTLTATAAPGHQFDSWTGCTAAGNSCTVIMNQPRTVTATLSRIQYQVTVSASPAAGGSVTGGGSYAANSSVTVVATAATGYSFVNWTEGGNVVATSPTYEFLIAGNRDLVATFQLMAYELSVTGAGDGNGTVTTTPAGIDCTVAGAVVSRSCTASYTHGTSVTLTAVPAAGHRFAGWSGSCTGEASTCTLSMTGASAVSASFMRIHFQVALSSAPAAGGSTTGAGTFPSLTTVTVIASPAVGYSFTNWSEGSNAVATTATYAFELTANRNLTANFQLQRFALTVAGSGSGSGVLSSTPAGLNCTLNAGIMTGACSALFDYQTAVTLTLALSNGSAFAAWTGCTGSATACTVTVTQAASASAALVGRPAGLTVARVADALVGRLTLTAAEVEYVDIIGNRNGRLDIGDFLALRLQ